MNKSHKEKINGCRSIILQPEIPLPVWAEKWVYKCPKIGDEFYQSTKLYKAPYTYNKLKYWVAVPKKETKFTYLNKKGQIIPMILTLILWIIPTKILKAIVNWLIVSPAKKLALPVNTAAQILSFFSLIGATCFGGYWAYQNYDKVITKTKQCIPSVNITWDDKIEITK